MVGKNVVILGSGDIGLIMARRLTLEGAKVHAVVEILSHSNGLPRNIQQCLIDYGIPLKLSHTVTEINGLNRVESVTISKVDENLKPIKGTEKTIPCDTLLLSVGLIPENDLSTTCGIELNSVTRGAIVNEKLETSVLGVFACGNVLHVHDVVDFVTIESEQAGKSAAEYILGKQKQVERINVQAGKGVCYVLPNSISKNSEVELLFRVLCPAEDASIGFFEGDKLVKIKKFRKVHPAQMIKVKLGKAETADISGLRIEVLQK